MKNLLFLGCIALFFLSSCASAFNGKTQKVEINTEKGTSLVMDHIDGDTLLPGPDGKYEIPREGKFQQIVIQKEGHKPEYVVLGQYKMSPLKILSFLLPPFLLGRAINADGDVIPNDYYLYGALLSIGVPNYDIGKRAKNYDKKVDLPSVDFQLPNKGELAKEIFLKKVSIDSEVEIKYQTFNKYMKGKEPRTSLRKSEPIEIENTIFSYALNRVLVEKGYIDTTRRAIKNDYLNNLAVEATIKDVSFLSVDNRSTTINGMYASHGKFVKTEIEVSWEVLDYYGKPLFSITTKEESGQISLSEYDIDFATVDAMEANLISFMNEKKVLELLMDRSQEKAEKEFETIELKTGNAYCSSISEVVKSSLTVKDGKGHGSGFFVSEDGYLITNYHVIANMETEDIVIVTNDNKEYKEVEIARVSKIQDLALLKIKGSGFVPVQISTSEEIELASNVYAIGTPTAQDLSQTISTGIISGVRKTEYDSKLIQTDASVNGGNSGGPLVNKQGLVLAVVSQKTVGFGVEGLAFGIPGYEVIKALKIKQ